MNKVRRREESLPTNIRLKYRCKGLDAFVERHAGDISRGGIFIRANQPLEVGTRIRFEFQFEDSSPLISGLGTVVWRREQEEGTKRAPGVGLRFDLFDGDGQAVLDVILKEKLRQSKGATSHYDTGLRERAEASAAVEDEPSAAHAASHLALTAEPTMTGAAPAERPSEQSEMILLPLRPAERVVSTAPQYLASITPLPLEVRRQLSAQALAKAAAAPADSEAESAVVEVAAAEEPQPELAAPANDNASITKSARRARQAPAQQANVADPPAPLPPISGPPTGVVPRGDSSSQDARFKLALHGVLVGTVLGIVLGLICGVGVTFVVMRDRQPAMMMMQPMGVPQTVMVTPPSPATPASSAAVRPRAVEVSSTPAGADILVDGAVVGRTPALVRNVDWQVPHELHLRSNGYQPQLLRVGPNDGFRARGSEDVLPLHATLQPAQLVATPTSPAETGAAAAAPSAHHDHHGHHTTAAVAKSTPRTAAADDGPKKTVKIPSWMTAGDSAGSD